MSLLEQVTQEHEQYQAGVDEFQRWLQAVVEKVTGCVGQNCKLATKHRLSALQVTHRVPTEGPPASPHVRGSCSLNRVVLGPKERLASMAHGSHVRRSVESSEKCLGPRLPSGHL